MGIIERSGALVAALALLLGCTSPAPEPATAEAIERAVTESELQSNAAVSSSEDSATKVLERAEAKGATT